jgi:ABC-type lipoprotein export system ATPase subunit
MKETGLECRDMSFAPRGWAEDRPPLLDGIDACFPEGTISLVTGPMGAGKSTLLHILSGLLRPTRGEVIAGGRPISRWTAAHRDRWRRGAGIAFQSSSLWPELTALENVILPMVPRGSSLPALRATGRGALESVGVGGLAGRSVRSLSGGERQRVSVARALVSRPAFLFVDEPTAHQDEEGVGQVLGAISSAPAWNATVVVASHDPRVAGADLFAHRWNLKDGGLERAR